MSWLPSLSQLDVLASAANTKQSKILLPSMQLQQMRSFVSLQVPFFMTIFMYLSKTSIYCINLFIYSSSVNQINLCWFSGTTQWRMCNFNEGILASKWKKHSNHFSALMSWTFFIDLKQPEYNIFVLNILNNVTTTQRYRILQRCQQFLSSFLSFSTFVIKYRYNAVTVSSLLITAI